jgi:hypothetical protein
VPYIDFSLNVYNLPSFLFVISISYEYGHMCYIIRQISGLRQQYNNVFFYWSLTTFDYVYRSIRTLFLVFVYSLRPSCLNQLKLNGSLHAMLLSINKNQNA